MSKLSSYNHAKSETGFFLKTVPAYLLCIYICFIATTAGNAVFALYPANLVKNTLPKKGGNLFPSFQLFLNKFSLEHVYVFIPKQSHFCGKW